MLPFADPAVFGRAFGKIVMEYQMGDRDCTILFRLCSGLSAGCFRVLFIWPNHHRSYF